MIERGINSPRTSSMGRLFDAAAAILGICDKATYEGEPAIELEAAAWRALDNEIAHFPDNNAGYFASGPSWLDGPYVLDQKALFEALLGGIEAGAPADRLALDFHVSVARSSARIASDICVHEGIDTVALSGGVFCSSSSPASSKAQALLSLSPTPYPSMTAASPTVRRQSQALVLRRLHRSRLFGQPASRRLTGVARLPAAPASATIN